MSVPSDLQKPGLFRVAFDSLFAVRLIFNEEWSFRITPARLFLMGLAAVAIAIVLVRLVVGLGAVTNLDDRWPWGLWIGFDVLCGVALAGGGYGTALLIHILHNKKLDAVSRATILTSLIGYILVVIGLFIEIGRWWNFWRPFWWWGYESILFEVFVCITLYTIVQTLEVCEIITEKVFRMFHRFFVIIMPFLLIFGVVLPTLHQSSLGQLYVMMEGKLHPLWWSPIIFFFFLLSSFFVGPAMIAVESVVTRCAYGHRAPVPAIRTLAKIGGAVMLVYLLLKFGDLTYRGALPFLWDGSYECIAFWCEIGFGVILPIMIVFSPLANYWGGLVVYGVLASSGVILNRMNVVITGMIRETGSVYIPAVTEILVTLGLVAGGILVYLFLCENFNILGHESHEKAE